MATQEELETQVKATGRRCGSCTMCCFIFGVNAPESDLVKPPHTKCKHCVAGEGCRIYERRPEPCRQFYCLWLIDSSLDELWYPATARIVVHSTQNDDGAKHMRFEVDPHRPDQWLQAPYFQRISNMTLHLRSIGCHTTLRCGKHRYLLLPRAITGTITMNNQTVDIISGRIGPGYIKSPLGEFEWREVSVPDDGAEWRQRSTAARRYISRL